jgi:dihydrofolate synthase/folylpolyglutamate synthase
METMELLFPGRKLNIVLGVLADKDFNAGIDIVLPHAKKFFAVTPPSCRALDAGELAASIRRKTDVSVAHFESVTAAIEAALAESGKDDVIAILGSLYQVRTVRDYFGRKTFEQ